MKQAVGLINTATGNRCVFHWCDLALYIAIYVHCEFFVRILRSSKTIGQTGSNITRVIFLLHNPAHCYTSELLRHCVWWSMLC